MGAMKRGGVAKIYMQMVPRGSSMGRLGGRGWKGKGCQAIIRGLGESSRGSLSPKMEILGEKKDERAHFAPLSSSQMRSPGLLAGPYI